MVRKITAVLASLTLVACGAGPRGADRADADEAGAESTPATAPISEAEAVAIGDSASTALTVALMARVRAEMERGGAAAAVAFCSERAAPLTAAVEDSLGRGLSIKRTSMRLRNPSNAPDSLELLALAYFEAESGSGSGLPDHYVQRTPEGWRYYKPITVAPLCTTCHGPAGSIDPAIRRVLGERYPDDRATGYSAGDLRGVVRVGIPASPPR